MTEIPPHFHKDYRIEERDIIPDSQIYDSLPERAEEGRFAVLRSGSSFLLYRFIDGSWRQVGAAPFSAASDLFSSFLDVVHWHAINGFIQTANSGSYTGNDGYLSLDVGSGGAGLYNFIASAQPYTKILEAGKLLSIEWNVANISDVAGCEIYLQFCQTPAQPVTTGHHFGFKLDSGNIKSSTADGTTQNISASLGGIGPVKQHTRLRAVANRGTDVKFYVDDVLLSTHTTNLPAVDDLKFNLGIKTTNTDAKHVWLNRILINKQY